MTGLPAALSALALASTASVADSEIAETRAETLVDMCSILSLGDDPPCPPGTGEPIPPCPRGGRRGRAPRRHPVRRPPPGPPRPAHPGVLRVRRTRGCSRPCQPCGPVPLSPWPPRAPPGFPWDPWRTPGGSTDGRFRRTLHGPTAVLSLRQRARGLAVGVS